MMWAITSHPVTTKEEPSRRSASRWGDLGRPSAMRIPSRHRSEEPVATLGFESADDLSLGVAPPVVSGAKVSYGGRDAAECVLDLDLQASRERAVRRLAALLV